MDEEKDGGIIGVQPHTVDFMSGPLPLSFRRRTVMTSRLQNVDVCVCVCVLPDGVNERSLQERRNEKMGKESEESVRE